jgi:hypothetical protein
MDHGRRESSFNVVLVSCVGAGDDGTEGYAGGVCTGTACMS